MFDYLFENLWHVHRTEVKSDVRLSASTAADRRQNRLGETVQPSAMAWLIGGSRSSSIIGSH
jgi:hypothetical protein